MKKKRVVAALRGTLQGGELQGDKGWYKLAGEKQINVVSLGITLLGLETWKEFEMRRFLGKSVFGCCFRRPLLSVFQEAFPFVEELTKSKNGLPPPRGVMDEVLMMVALTPLWEPP